MVSSGLYPREIRILYLPPEPLQPCWPLCFVPMCLALSCLGAFALAVLWLLELSPVLTVGALPSFHPAAVSSVMTCSLVPSVHFCRALPLPSVYGGPAVEGLEGERGEEEWPEQQSLPERARFLAPQRGNGPATRGQHHHQRAGAGLLPCHQSQGGAGPALPALPGLPSPRPPPGIACTVSPGSHLHPSLVLSGLGLEQVETHGCQTPLDLPGVPQ